MSLITWHVRCAGGHSKRGSIASIVHCKECGEDVKERDDGWMDDMFFLGMSAPPQDDGDRLAEEGCLAGAVLCAVHQCAPDTFRCSELAAKPS